MIRELVECFKISEEGVEKNGEGVKHPPEVVLNMWPYKNVSHIQVQLFTSFATPPTHKTTEVQWFTLLQPHPTKPRLQIGERLLIAHHLDESLWCANQSDLESTSSSRHIIFITLFSSTHRCGAPFFSPASQQSAQNYAEPKTQNHSAELNRHVLTFLHPISSSSEGGAQLLSTDGGSK